MRARVLAYLTLGTVFAGCGLDAAGTALPPNGDDGGPDVVVVSGDGGSSGGGDDATIDRSVANDSGADVRAADVAHDVARDAVRDVVSEMGGVCSPGATQCSGNGVQTCDSQGQWGGAVDCGNATCVGGVCQGACAPGQTQMVTCGNCGMETDTCGSGGTWVPGACNGQGPCAQGAMQSCNTYGSQTCGANCNWGACSCPANAQCAPGATQCGGGGMTQPQQCNSMCAWANNGPNCGAGTQCSNGHCTCGVSTNCQGCCANNNSSCPNGFADNACGTAGAACVDCTATGQKCHNGLYCM